MEDNSLIRDLTVGNPLRQLVTFSLPFMVSNLLQQVYSLADTIIVGQLVGSAGLTATSNASEMVMIWLFTAIGFASSGQIIISQHIGAGNRERLNAAIGTTLTFIGLLGVLVTFLPLLLIDPMIAWLNIPAEAAQGARDYALVSYLGMIPVCGYNAVGAILRGLGDSKHPMLFVSLASVLNVFLDLLFVGPLGMGCFGAALATVMSQCIAFIWAMVFLYRNRSRVGFDFRPASFRLDRAELKPLVTLGFPLALQSCLVSISMLFVNSMINAYGVTAAAVTAVGNKLAIVANICCGALNTAGATITAQNFAAGKHDRVVRVFVDVLLLGLVFAAVCSLIVVLFPEQIFSLFNSEPAVLEMSHRYVPIAVLNFVGFAVRCAAFAFINGIGYSTLAFIGGIFDGLIGRIGLCVLFGRVLGLGVFGCWLGSTLAGFVFLFIGGGYLLTGRWKKRRAIVD